MKMSMEIGQNESKLALLEPCSKQKPQLELVAWTISQLGSLPWPLASL